MKSLAGKTVVVMGASSGLGAALAEGFARAGANLVLFARSLELTTEVAQRFQTEGAAPLVVSGDVTVEEDCARLMDRANERFGRIDVVVYSAGVGMWARFDQLERPGILRQVMDVNYGGLVNVAFYALPHLKRSRGLLVAISSVQGKFGVPYHSGYAASKHAVQGLCDSLRMELKGERVDLLTVLPHWMRGTRLREQAFGRNGKRCGPNSADHATGALPVDAVARHVLEAVAKRRRQLFIPWWMQYFTWLSVLAPRWADSLISRRVDRENVNGTSKGKG
jgi:short-subunit dehydrogenase